MGTVRTDEFRKDAVRIALSSKDQKMMGGHFPDDAPTAILSSTSHRTCWIVTSRQLGRTRKVA
jgi:hypothetical protein